jgi:hypothetical protein
MKSRRPITPPPVCQHSGSTDTSVETLTPSSMADRARSPVSDGSPLRPRALLGSPQGCARLPVRMPPLDLNHRLFSDEVSRAEARMTCDSPQPPSPTDSAGLRQRRGSHSTTVSSTTTTPQDTKASALAVAAEDIRRQLGERGYASRSPHGTPEEDALEDLYVHHAAQTLLERRKIFGDDYELCVNMPKHGGQRAARGVYDALHSMCVSAARSPVSLAIAAWYSKEAFPVASDVDLIAGAAGGGTSSLMNKILADGVTRTVEKFNLPIMGALHDSQLERIFGSPSPVALEVKNGVKHYRRLSNKELKVRGNQIDCNIDAVKRLRASFKGQGLGSMHIQGVLSGVAHTVRHQLSAEGDWSFVLRTAGAASGLDGLCTSPILSAMQTHQIKVDNLVGGQQRVSLFPVQRPRPDVRSPGIKDLPSVMAYSVREMAALAGQFGYNLSRRETTVPQVLDVVRYMASNSIARRAAREFGQAMGAVFRNGRELPFAGEKLHSLANAATRFTAYWAGDTVWKVFKQNSEASAGFDLGKSLDHRRDAKMAAWEKQAFNGLKEASEKLNALAQENNDSTPLLPLGVAHLLDQARNSLNERPINAPKVLQLVRRCVKTMVDTPAEPIESVAQTQEAAKNLIVARFRSAAHQLNTAQKAQANQAHLQKYRQGPLVAAHEFREKNPITNIDDEAHDPVEQDRAYAALRGNNTDSAV